MHQIGPWGSLFTRNVHQIISRILIRSACHICFGMLRRTTHYIRDEFGDRIQCAASIRWSQMNRSALVLGALPFWWAIRQWFNVYAREWLIVFTLYTWTSQYMAFGSGLPLLLRLITGNVGSKTLTPAIPKTKMIWFRVPSHSLGIRLHFNDSDKIQMWLLLLSWNTHRKTICIALEHLNGLW